MYQVGRGKNIMNRTNLSSQSLRNYMKAAHRVLTVWLGRSIPIYDPTSFGKQLRYHEFLGQQLRDRRNWEKKRPQKLALTVLIYEALATHLAMAGNSVDSFLDVFFAGYDWLRLGAFAAFRISEFGQAKVRKGQKFLHVPVNDDVPEAERGRPLAFIAEDFQFFSADLTLISHDQLLACHRLGRIQFVQIRWRYDKSAHNFVFRRYALSKDTIFNPVDAAVNIVYRARLLHVPPTEPLGVWKNPRGRRYRFIRDSAITKVMRTAVALAYPDPHHYYRINIASFVPHCIRVTAAVAMRLGGAENDETAHSKRWHPTSVPTYDRDTFEAAHNGQNKTIAGLAVLGHRSGL